MKKETKLIAFIVTIIVVGVIGYLIYSGQKAAAPNTSVTNAVQNGGVGSSLTGLWHNIFGSSNVGNSNCTQGKPSKTNPCIDDCGFPISSDVNPLCV